jgi:hypothetical protein
VQPWFCHWSWVVPAAALSSQLALKRGTIPSINAEVSIDLANGSLEKTKSALRLCHFLDAVARKSTTTSVMLIDGGFAADFGKDFPRLIQSQILAAQTPTDDVEQTLPIIVQFR